MTEERNYTLYMHTNLINDKKYIGITKQSLIKRFRTNGIGYKRCKYFWKAIQKYGWNNFKHEVLLCNLTKGEAEMFEIALIKYYNTTNKKYGYNISAGGEIPNNIKLPHKKIICFETRQIFDSTISLSNTLGVKIQRVYFACNNIVYKLKGLHYCYLNNFNDNYIKYLNNFEPKKIKKAVICLETKNIFYSIEECGKKMNILPSDISLVCNHKRKTAHKLHFMFLSEYDKNKTYDLSLPNKKNNCKQVICINDGCIFNSLTECANYYHIDNSCLSAVCKGKRKTAKGLTFKYYTENNNAIKLF